MEINQNCVYIPQVAYWLTQNEVEDIERKNNAKYISYWYLENEVLPVDVFYSVNGPKHYFGVTAGLDGTIVEFDIINSFENDLIAYRYNGMICIPKSAKDIEVAKSLGLESLKVRVFHGDFIPVGVTEE